LLHLPEARSFRVASRRFYGSPAAGSSIRSNRRHQEVIDYVFNKAKNNMN
jgi:2-oxoglutarate dehydrogenase E1 component